jgi:hypothetical protein
MPFYTSANKPDRVTNYWGKFFLDTHQISIREEIDYLCTGMMGDNTETIDLLIQIESSAENCQQSIDHRLSGEFKNAFVIWSPEDTFLYLKLDKRKYLFPGESNATHHLNYYYIIQPATGACWQRQEQSGEWIPSIPLKIQPQSIPQNPFAALEFIIPDEVRQTALRLALGASFEDSDINVIPEQMPFPKLVAEFGDRYLEFMAQPAPTITDLAPSQNSWRDRVKMATPTWMGLNFLFSITCISCWLYPAFWLFAENKPWWLRSCILPLLIIIELFLLPFVLIIWLVLMLSSVWIVSLILIISAGAKSLAKEERRETYDYLRDRFQLVPFDRQHKVYTRPIEDR